MTISINGINQSVPSKEDHGRGVQDITELKTVGPSERFDRQERYVEDETRPYYFDIQSVSVESLPDIVDPGDSPAAGRWIRLPGEGGPPAAHAASHTDGSDQVAAVTGAVNGLMTAADKTKLNGIGALANVTSVFGRTGVVVAVANDYAHAQLSAIGVNDHHAALHAADHVTGGAQKIRDATAAVDGLATAAQITKLDAIEAGAEVNDVFSVFGRTGAVVAAVADYTHAQMAGIGTDDHHSQAHTMGSGDHGADTLAALNSKVVGTTLVDSDDIVLVSGANALTGTLTTQNIQADGDATRTIGADAVGYAKVVTNTLRPSSTGTPNLVLRAHDNSINMEIRSTSMLWRKSVAIDGPNARDIGTSADALRRLYTRFIQADNNGTTSLTLEDVSVNAVVVIADAADMTFTPIGHIVHSSLFRQSIAAGVTAAVSSIQGGGPITTSIVQIATVTTTGDAVTLPPAIAGLVVTIENNGVNAADVFPDVGDKINDAGVNLAEALPASEFVQYYSRDGVNWSTLSKTYTGGGGVTDHGALTGLSDDDHSIYALLLGRSGGQTLIGGTATGNNLTLQSTSHATKGSILFGTSAYDEVNNRLGVGLTAPVTRLTVEGTITLKEQAEADGDTPAYGQLWVNTAVPNELFFTTDDGDDREIAYAGGAFHDGMSDFVANEHIDWTDASQAFKTSGPMSYIGPGDAADGMLRLEGSTGNLARMRIVETGDTTDSQHSGYEIRDGSTFKAGMMKNGLSHDLSFWTVSKAMTIFAATNKIAINTSTAAPAYLSINGTLAMVEKSVPESSIAAWGQVWVKSASPNELWFTDDIGVDHQIAYV